MLGVTQVTCGNDLGFWIYTIIFILITSTLCFKIHQSAYKFASPHSVCIFLELLLKVLLWIILKSDHNTENLSIKICFWNILVLLVQ